MANPEHVEILKQGVEVWNQWRRDNPDIMPKLKDADITFTNLRKTDLSYADLNGANLSLTDLSDADLNSADLSHATLSFANLSGANLSRANHRFVNLSDAILSHADFRNTNLSLADLRRADLSDADLRYTIFLNANLSGANLSRASLAEANFQHAICHWTVFAELDLSTTKGLEKITHEGPSTLGMDTYFKSQGKIPEIFLRGCGVPETLITFLPSMLEEAIQFYSCFISYSHDDKEFAKRLHDRLQGQGIRCWLDEHQLKPGDELHKTIYEGIRVYDKVILCCSETALKSWWVEKEFKNAISKEEDYTETVLIPITLDDYVFKQSADNWTVGEIKRRFVGDFSKWKEHDAFEQAFKRVVEALKTKDSHIPHPKSKLPRREQK